MFILATTMQAACCCSLLPPATQVRLRFVLLISEIRFPGQDVYHAFQERGLSLRVSVV